VGVTDREKVIKGLECHLSQKCETDSVKKEICPYWEEEECSKKIMYDALEILKERPVIIEGNTIIHIGQCPKCKTVLNPWGAKFCWKCGQAVTWE
jgi:hypothetical protein